MGSGRKRPRGAGEMGRVAEIVMVLAAAGEARGGRAPTAAERALVAEAWGRLAASVAAVEVRPKELYPSEVVRALVADLGLGRARDPAAMGYRPRRASIAERVLLTKRKMNKSRNLQYVQPLMFLRQQPQVQPLYSRMELPSPLLDYPGTCQLLGHSLLQPQPSNYDFFYLEAVPTK